MKRKGKNINPHLKHLIKKNQVAPLSIDAFLLGLKKQDKVVTSRAISLIESTHPEHRAQAMTLLEACMKVSSKSVKIGISGTPGVGKSTFIDSFGMRLIKKGFSVAVLAVDPSSGRTGGSILGDKTRMSRLAVQEKAFIRPSAAGKTLGGVANTTRETIALCEAAQYDYILVETVGVGQSETLVSSMVDMYMVLLLPGGGDELQGIKRGIVELADLIVINKSDGKNATMAKLSQRAYNNGLHYFSPGTIGWTPKAVLASGLHDRGIEEVFNDIKAYLKLLYKNDGLQKKRHLQNLFWYDNAIKSHLETFIFMKPEVEKAYNLYKEKVKNNALSPFKGAYLLVQQL